MDPEKSDLIQKYSFIVIKVNEPQTGANAISINYGTTLFFYIHKLYFFVLTMTRQEKKKSGHASFYIIITGNRFTLNSVCEIKVRRLETDHRTKRFATLNCGWMGENLNKNNRMLEYFTKIFNFTPVFLIKSLDRWNRGCKKSSDFVKSLLLCEEKEIKH